MSSLVANALFAETSWYPSFKKKNVFCVLCISSSCTSVALWACQRCVWRSQNNLWKVVLSPSIMCIPGTKLRLSPLSTQPFSHPPSFYTFISCCVPWCWKTNYCSETQTLIYYSLAHDLGKFTNLSVPVSSKEGENNNVHIIAQW